MEAGLRTGFPYFGVQSVDFKKLADSAAYFPSYQKHFMSYMPLRPPDKGEEDLYTLYAIARSSLQIDD